MTEEEQAVYDAALKAKEEVDAKLAEAETAKSNLVVELKEERRKKQEALEAVSQTQDKPEENQSSTGDTRSEVERVLAEREAAEAKNNREKAIEEFRNSSQFSEASDPGGLKFQAFERELRKFNLDSLKTVDDFKGRFKEVHQFMDRAKGPDNETVNIHRGTPRNSGGDSGNNDTYVLDSTEKKLLEQTGWTQDRYLKLKEKQPAFVEQQLNLMSR